MPTRRQEKVARLVREVVSDAIVSHLSDPRIMGIVSVTRVAVTADIRNADVYLSVFGTSDSEKNRTFEAITHARARIQSLLAAAMHCKFCPVLRFHKDEQFQKMLETMRLIDQVASEHREEGPEPDEQEESSRIPDGS